MPKLRGSRVHSTLNQVLASAVVLNWNDLMGDANPGQIHIEYQREGQSLSYLKVWSCTAKGVWRLLCEYWVRPRWSHVKGVTFSHHRSDVFARTLRFLVIHQHSFSKNYEPVHGGLVPVQTPTEDQRVAARQLLERVTKRIAPHRAALQSRPMPADTFPVAAMMWADDGGSQEKRDDG